MKQSLPGLVMTRCRLRHKRVSLTSSFEIPVSTTQVGHLLLPWGRRARSSRAAAPASPEHSPRFMNPRPEQPLEMGPLYFCEINQTM